MSITSSSSVPKQVLANPMTVIYHKRSEGICVRNNNTGDIYLGRFATPERPGTPAYQAETLRNFSQQNPNLEIGFFTGDHTEYYGSSKRYETAMKLGTIFSQPEDQTTKRNLLKLVDKAISGASFNEGKIYPIIDSIQTTDSKAELRTKLINLAHAMRGNNFVDFKYYTDSHKLEEAADNLAPVGTAKLSRPENPSIGTTYVDASGAYCYYSGSEWYVLAGPPGSSSSTPESKAIKDMIMVWSVNYPKENISWTTYNQMVDKGVSTHTLLTFKDAACKTYQDSGLVPNLGPTFKAGVDQLLKSTRTKAEHLDAYADLMTGRLEGLNAEWKSMHYIYMVNDGYPGLRKADTMVKVMQATSNYGGTLWSIGSTPNKELIPQVGAAIDLVVVNIKSSRRGYGPENPYGPDLNGIYDQLIDKINTGNPREAINYAKDLLTKADIAIKYP